ncbi:binuclear zinc transcription factor [Podospora didyma]|uniref:Binuclear zinc transcription factor n=1 Tax=Podospora didyma TaxID=330526 RepID=A0AAE0K1A3_9PEZI|nr:binuclear zinc transcription factor [Podospora didyma]
MATSSTSPEDGPTEPSTAGGDAAPACEVLACVHCRTRKLKCDRTRPVCARCVKAGNECLYPESRRKPAFRRKNVRELEERLAQVEDMLKTVGKHPRDRTPESDPASADEVPPPQNPERPFSPPRKASDYDFDELLRRTTSYPQPVGVPPCDSLPSESPQSPDVGKDNGSFAQFGELMGLGMSESLPPFEMIEELHHIYFKSHQGYIPVVHKGRYLSAFHSPPHMRPPLCLQYAMWTMAANGHEKYGRYHDVFYQRARQYLELDELRGDGEHFITVAHAQTWAIIAADEARGMYFTRAAMSSARCVRLVEMMGLHRLDDPLREDNNFMSPMLVPPKNWVELEERRRVFWAAFSMDAHASVSTGWPNLIDFNQVTTNLPSSEEAYNNCTEETAPKLRDVFNGAQYSSFAAAVIMCYIFIQLMKHVHRPRPDDRPEDMEHGRYWKRHRELDNMLSSSFMFIPEPFRLPRNIRDPVALQTNLNLHASVICIHVAACHKADKYNLPTHVKQISKARCLMAAQEIINIMKLTSHMTASYKGSLVALSLYYAAVAYIYAGKDNPNEFESENLEFIIKCMDVMGRQPGFVITRAYLNQVLIDIEHNGLAASINVTRPEDQFTCKQGVPLLARTAITHGGLHPPLPGRLPLGNPLGTKIGHLTGGFECETTTNPNFREDLHVLVIEESSSDPIGHPNKRVRTSAAPEGSNLTAEPLSNIITSQSQIFSPSSWPGPDAIPFSQKAGFKATTGSTAAANWSGMVDTMRQVKLPHHRGSPSMAANRPTPPRDPIYGIVGNNLTISNVSYSENDMIYSGNENGGLSLGEGSQSSKIVADSSGNSSTTNNNTGSVTEMPDLSLFQGGIDQWDLSPDDLALYPDLYAMGDMIHATNSFETSTNSSGDPWTLLDSGNGAEGSAGNSNNSWENTGGDTR